MSLVRLLAVGSTIAVLSALLMSPTDAQTRRNANQTASQAKREAAAAAAVEQAPKVEKKCLKALDGKCADQALVEAARLRAEVIPAARVSYWGTPAGTIGGAYIPFERTFQDNPLVYGLPTFTFVQPCCTTRTK